jgi:hypothetical protein
VIAFIHPSGHPASAPEDFDKEDFVLYMSLRCSTMFQQLPPTITDNLGKMYEIPFPELTTKYCYLLDLDYNECVLDPALKPFSRRP